MLQLFADLQLRWKIALPISLLAVLLVVIGVLGMQGINQVADDSVRLTNRHLPAISLLLNADRDLYQAFNAVKAMHSGSAKARHSVEQAASVDGALSAAGESVARINDMTAQIATVCEEQSSVTEEIARNISDIRDLSNEAAPIAEQSTQTNAHLSDLARNLAQLVGRFRV